MESDAKKFLGQENLYFQIDSSPHPLMRALKGFARLPIVRTVVAAGLVFSASGCSDFIKAISIGDPKSPHAQSREYNETPLISIGGSVDDPSSTVIGRSDKITAPPEDIPDFESKIINGIEVFGDQNAITREQLPEFINFLNKREQDVILDPATYFGTIIAYKDVYDQFPKDNGEDLEAFLARHEQVLTERISVAESKIRLNKLIILNVNLGESVTGFDKIAKSDGFWILDKIYKASNSIYWDSKNNIDWGLGHELGHVVLHLPDQYPLDVNHQTNLVHTSETLQALEGIPEEWHTYWASKRQDIGNDLMANTFDNVLHVQKTGDFSIKKHTYLQLLRRLKNNDVHNKETLSEKCWCFPNEIPEISYLFLGQEYSNLEVEIDRSFEQYPDKRPDFYSRKKSLEKVGTYTLSEKGVLTLSRDNIFPSKGNNLIPAENSVLLIKIKGKNVFRWMDIRDFNIAYWLGYKKEVNMYMKMITASDRQTVFPWNIYYGGNIDN